MINLENFKKSVNAFHDDTFIDLAQLEQDIVDAINEAFDQWLEEILAEDNEYEN